MNQEPDVPGTLREKNSKVEKVIYKLYLKTIEHNIIITITCQKI